MATNDDLARLLLAAAKEDELAAKSVLQVEGISDPIIGFHTHQAVEKAIKAVLAAKGTEFPFTHNLELLRSFSEESGIELPSTLDGMQRMNPFAAAERYGSEVPTDLDRDQALQWAAAAITWAQTFVETTSTESEQSAQLGPRQTPRSSD